MAIKVSDEELKLDVAAYEAAGGNRSEAARQRKMPRKSYTKRLSIAEKRFGITLGKIADGRVEAVSSASRPLPRKGQVKRYVLTSAQNNTHVHPAFDNLQAYVSWLDGLDGSSCELI